MNIRWGVLSLSLIFSSSAATPARATVVRVNSIGQAGLLPDEEQDLDVAGAFVYDVMAPRLFTTLGVRRERSVTSLVPAKNTRSMLGASTGIRYVGALGPLPFALRYSPSYTEERFRDLSSHAEIYTRTRANAGLVLGLGGGDRWKLAVEPFYRDLYTHSDSSFNTGEREQDEYGVKGSLLWGEKGSFRVAASLAGGRVRNKNTDLLTGLTVNNFQERSYGLTVVPELPLWGGMSRFLLRATAHHSDLDVPSPFIQERSSDLVLDAGAGLTFPAGAEGLWHTSFLYSRIGIERENIDFVPPSKLASENVSQTGTWRLGTEKPIVPGVTLMASVNLLSFRDDRASTNTGLRADSTELNWYSGMTMGLGLQPADSLRIDFNFAAVTSTSVDRHIRDIGTTFDSKDKIFIGEIEVDYRF